MLQRPNDTFGWSIFNILLLLYPWDKNEAHQHSLGRDFDLGVPLCTLVHHFADAWHRYRCHDDQRDWMFHVRRLHLTAAAPHRTEIFSQRATHYHCHYKGFITWMGTLFFGAGWCGPFVANARTNSSAGVWTLLYIGHCLGNLELSLDVFTSLGWQTFLSRRHCPQQWISDWKWKGVVPTSKRQLVQVLKGSWEGIAPCDQTYFDWGNRVRQQYYYAFMWRLVWKRWRWRQDTLTSPSFHPLSYVKT